MGTRTRLILWLLMPALLFSARGHAQSIVVQPRITAGIQDYSLNFDDVLHGDPGGGFFFRNGFKVQDHLHLFGAGVTVSYGKLFLDLSGQRTDTGHDIVEQFEAATTGSGSTGAANLGLEHQLDSSFDRKEFNASVGWGVTPQFSAYVGYKHAQLNLAQHMQPVPTAQPVVGDLLFLGTRSIGFSYNGYFIGATYSFPVETLHGAFAVQTSVARLNGVFRESFLGAVGEVEPGNQLLPIDTSFLNKAPIYGKSTGLNAGISWTGNLDWMSERLSRLSYTLGLDRSEYKFDTNETTTGNFEETSTRVRLDLRYRFNVGRQ